MIDHVTKERRSEIMRAVPSNDSKPELLVRKAAHKLGLRFRLHSKTLPGKPDLVFPRWQTVIFVNGCFWHRHPDCKKSSTPKTNVDFWEKKFRDNVSRDNSNYKKLESLGWKYLILWQCQIKTVEHASALIKQFFKI